MASDKGFQNIDQLVAQLSKGISELDQGKVDVSQLEEMCATASEVYERLIVLRHKGREAMSEGEAQVDLTEGVTAEVPEMKLDLNEPIVSSGQTSLIDAIAETTGEQATSIADRVGSASIDDLQATIGLNQKFMFISQLFGGDNNRYQETIETLSNMSEKKEAMDLVRSLAVDDSEDAQSALEQFKDLLERKFG